MLKLIFVFVLAATSSLLRYGKRGFGPMDFMMGEHSLIPDVSIQQYLEFKKQDPDGEVEIPGKTFLKSKTRISVKFEL